MQCLWGVKVAKVRNLPEFGQESVFDKDVCTESFGGRDFRVVNWLQNIIITCNNSLCCKRLENRNGDYL